LIKKITTAGRDTVTTLPAVISIHLLIVRKNFNTNFIILYRRPGLAEGLAVYIAEQPKHNNKNNDTAKATASPFPPGIARDQRSPEIVHS
jgi:hypothetical protein